MTLKLEHLQVAGSFKSRGAFANLLLRKVPQSGVVAASGGNHGAAVAYAAIRLAYPARVFVPIVSSPAKIDRIRSYGAELCIAQAATIDTVLVAVGGGGLIGGIAAWHRGEVRVVGVEPTAAPTLTAALQAGRPVDAPAGGIAADSLAPRRVGELVFPIAQAYVDRVVVVGDREIESAQAALWEVARVVAEPGGAAPLAAVLSGAYRPDPREHVVVIVSGGNADLTTFAGSAASK